MDQWLNQYMKGRHRKSRVICAKPTYEIYQAEIEFNGRSDLVALFKLAYG